MSSPELLPDFCSSMLGRSEFVVVVAIDVNRGSNPDDIRIGSVAEGEIGQGMFAIGSTMVSHEGWSLQNADLMDVTKDV